MTRHQTVREVAGELLGTALLVTVAFASGAVRVQLGAETMGGALLGSLALGLVLSRLAPPEWGGGAPRAWPLGFQVHLGRGKPPSSGAHTPEQQLLPFWQ